MKAWALGHPMMARVLLRLVLRMAMAVALALALAVMVPLLPMVERYGVSPNIAAITAVVVGLLVGAKLAERVAKLWGLPEEMR